MTLIDAIQTVWGDMTSAFATVADVNTLVWLATTVMVYAVSLQIFRYCGGQPLLHPLILTTAGMAGVLAIIGVEIDSYQSYAQLLHWLLLIGCSNQISVLSEIYKCRMLGPQKMSEN